MASFNAPLRIFLIFLSLFYVSLASDIMPRQSPSADATIAPTNCLDYSRIANLTTVSNNATYRAAFLRSANMGTLKAAKTLDRDAAKLMALQLDSQLNGQCGNLTTIAIQASGTNFTQGTVLGFKILADVGVVSASFAMPLCWILITLLFGGVFISV
jgi:hypothetical protein